MRRSSLVTPPALSPERVEGESPYIITTQHLVILDSVVERAASERP